VLLDGRCRSPKSDGTYQKEKRMNLKIEKNPRRCHMTVAVDKADLFDVLQNLLNIGQVQICGIEEAPTITVEEMPVQPPLRRLC
jgi:hypothetical protein